jgi:uncharacterized protein YjiS (DUF1127 family)
MLHCSKRIPAVQTLACCIRPASPTLRSEGNAFPEPKEPTMTNRYAKTYRAWRMYRDTCVELMRLSNRDLRDIGVNRGDIPAIAMKCAREIL